MANVDRCGQRSEVCHCSCVAHGVVALGHLLPWRDIGLRHRSICHIGWMSYNNSACEPATRDTTPPGQLTWPRRDIEFGCRHQERDPSSVETKRVNQSRNTVAKPGILTHATPTPTRQQPQTPAPFRIARHSTDTADRHIGNRTSRTLGRTTPASRPIPPRQSAAIASAAPREKSTA